MKSVLIVDDEYYIRIRVRKCVDWSALGFDEIDEAECGQDVLRLMEFKKYDLLILDITMPSMDGLTLLKIIRQKNSDLKVIILTGYDKFEYAKTALSLDVTEYILKPIIAEEMEDAVKKACQQINTQQDIQEKLEENIFLRKQEEGLKANVFLNSVLLGNSLVNTDILERLEKLGIHSTKKYRLVYFQHPNTEEVQILKKSLITAKTTAANSSFWVFEEIYQDQILKELKEYLNCGRIELYFGISGVHSGRYEQLHMAAQEASLMYCQNLYEEGSEFIFEYEKYFKKLRLKLVENSNRFKELFFEVSEKMNRSLVEKYISEFFEFLQEHRFSVLEIHLSLEQIFHLIKHLYIQSGDEWINASWLEMQAFEIMVTCGSLDHLKAQLEEIIYGYLEKKNSFAVNAGNLLVKKIQEIVQNNYMDCSLGLSSIAETLSFNSSYLSDVFKRFYGQPLTKYITFVRMEKAKKFLSTGEYSVTEVMEKVGYNDPYYFSKIFKKTYGITPSAFVTLKYSNFPHQ